MAAMETGNVDSWNEVDQRATQIAETRVFCHLGFRR